MNPTNLSPGLGPLLGHTLCGSHHVVCHTAEQTVNAQQDGARAHYGRTLIAERGPGLVSARGNCSRHDVGGAAAPAKETLKHSEMDGCELPPPSSEDPFRGKSDLGPNPTHLQLPPYPRYPQVDIQHECSNNPDAGTWKGWVCHRCCLYVHEFTCVHMHM